MNPTVSTVSEKTGSRSLVGQPLSLLAFGSLIPLSKDSEDFQHLAQLAGQLLEDPAAMRRLSERVLEMLTLDLQQHRDRIR